MAEGPSEPGSVVGVSMEREQAQANFEEQNDEILALESILEQNVTLRSRHQEEEEDSRFAFKVAVPVDLPRGQLEVQLWLPGDSDVKEAEAAAVCSSASSSRPEFNRSMSGRRWHASFNVSHLPPLTLDLTLPPTYPSHDPPCFVISCLWLDRTKLSTLCKQLDALWEESKGLPIIYTWVDWLQSSTIQFLGLDDYIILMPMSMRFDGAATPEEKQNFQSDLRVLSEQADPVQCLQEILRFNYAKEFEAFQRNTQECGICFDSKLGAEFFLMSECRHFFCQECVAGYCQIHVKDGTVHQISCPDEGCDGSLPPDVIRQVLGKEEYQRWESLLLQKTLDTMDDVVWCPRCNNVVIRDADQDSKLAQCGSCLFCFCTSCGDAWHQSRECRSVEEKLQDLTKQLLGDKAGEVLEGTEEEIKLFAAAKNVRDPKEFQRKAQLLSRLRAERLSKSTITKTTKCCPQCRTNIEKSEGCNKMTCSKCGTHFCWLCCKKINGYDHFGSKCVLFQVNVPPAVFNRVPEREVPEGMRRLPEALDRDPEAIHRVKNCPNCRQRNLKTGTNNHLKCWSCRANICYQCLTKITGPVTSHFIPPNPCKQHS